MVNSLYPAELVGIPAVRRGADRAWGGLGGGETGRGRPGGGRPPAHSVVWCASGGRTRAEGGSPGGCSAPHVTGLSDTLGTEPTTIPAASFCTARMPAESLNVYQVTRKGVTWADQSFYLVPQ
jgi:hypothetical protein